MFWDYRCPEELNNKLCARKCVCSRRKWRCVCESVFLWQIKPTILMKVLFAQNIRVGCSLRCHFAGRYVCRKTFRPPSLPGAFGASTPTRVSRSGEPCPFGAVLVLLLLSIFFCVFACFPLFFYVFFLYLPVLFYVWFVFLCFLCVFLL